MKTKLKICGITNLQDARYISASMVDYLGFLFYPHSPRFVKPSIAADIVKWIEGPEVAGVFVNQPIDEINKIIKEAGLDLVQLHGEEKPEEAKNINAPIIKAFRIPELMEPQTLEKKIKKWIGTASFLLFDGFDPIQYGGTGKEWNFSMINEICMDLPFFLAGGISSENIEKITSEIRPYAIDLSSSIEAAPGIKDFEKIDLFFEQWQQLKKKQS